MARYIDADKLLKDLCTVSAPTPSESWIVEKCIEKVNEQPTADVVPKSEVDRLTNILDSYALQYGTVMDKHIVIEKAREEVAREIFEEIGKIIDTYGDEYGTMLTLEEDEYAELKKKYTESEDKE